MNEQAIKQERRLHYDHFHNLAESLKQIHTVKNYFTAYVLYDWVTDINDALPEANIDEIFDSHKKYYNYLATSLHHDQEIVTVIANYFDNHKQDVYDDLKDLAPEINIENDNQPLPVEPLENINDFSEDYYHMEIGEEIEKLCQNTEE